MSQRCKSLHPGPGSKPDFFGVHDREPGSTVAARLAGNAEDEEAQASQEAVPTSGPGMPLQVSPHEQVKAAPHL